MIKIEKYMKTKLYMTPSGAVATPAFILNNYPAVEYFTFVVETDEAGEVMFALQNLSALRSQLGIPQSLTEAEAIVAIEEKRNIVTVDTTITAQERIAAALEYQVLMSMEDEG